VDPFAELEQQYPASIQRMRNRFNAHQFILDLARHNQRLYILALAQYIDSDAPFMIVHGRLARALHNWENLIQKVGGESSPDIFGHPNGASIWVKR
jgi:hypothetical protein